MRPWQQKASLQQQFPWLFACTETSGFTNITIANPNVTFSNIFQGIKHVFYVGVFAQEIHCYDSMKSLDLILSILVYIKITWELQLGKYPQSETRYYTRSSFSKTKGCSDARSKWIMVVRYCCKQAKGISDLAKRITKTNVPVLHHLSWTLGEQVLLWIKNWLKKR